MSEKVCPQCGKTFKPKRGNAIYCSPECGLKYRAEKYRSPRTKLERGFTYRDCDVCGRPFLAQKATTCKKCWNNAHRDRYSKRPKTKVKERVIQKELTEMVDEARSLGVSYGYLVAMKERRIARLSE